MLFSYPFQQGSKNGITVFASFSPMLVLVVHGQFVVITKTQKNKPFFSIYHISLAQCMEKQHQDKCYVLQTAYQHLTDRSKTVSQLSTICETTVDQCFGQNVLANCCLTDGSLLTNSQQMANMFSSRTVLHSYQCFKEQTDLGLGIMTESNREQVFHCFPSRISAFTAVSYTNLSALGHPELLLLFCHVWPCEQLGPTLLSLL